MVEKARVERLETISKYKFILIVGNNSESIFEYLGKEEWSGLSAKEAKAYKETDSDAYIAGWTNELPPKHPDRKWSTYFIFLNKRRLEKKYLSQVHESVHLAKAVMDYPIITDKNEEEFSTIVEHCYRAIIFYFDNNKDGAFKLKLKEIK